MRKSFTAVIFAVLLFTFTPVNTSAHSALESSSPKDEEVLTRSVSNVTLTFDTKVEMESEFKITNKKDEKQMPDQVKRSGNSLEGIFNSPLKDGSYTVRWQIVGEDGHPVDGETSFQIKGNDTNGENDKGGKSTNNNSSKTTTNDSQQPPKNDDQDHTSEKSSTFLVVLIALLLIIASVTLLRLFRKRS